jgi:hypothetical protein
MAVHTGTYTYYKDFEMLVISSLKPSSPGPDHFCPEQYNAVATFLFV